MRYALPIAVFTAFVGFALPARGEGPGIRLGDTLVFHPGIAVGTGYDTNVFYGSGNNSFDQPVGGVNIQVIPTLDLATRPAQRGGTTPHTLDFRFHAGVPMRILMPTNTAFAGRNSYDVETGLQLALFPFGNYAFDLVANFARNMLAPYALSDVPSVAKTIDIDRGQLALKLKLRPGGQRLEISLGYMLGVQYFENAIYRGRSGLSNDFQLRVAWKFFPKTALYLNASETIFTYFINDPTTPPSAYPFRVVLGLIGLITPTLSLNANIGYANSFTRTNDNFPSVQSYNMVIGQLEASWKPLLTTALALGYRHDTAQALVGTYYAIDNPYLQFIQQIWRLTGTLRMDYEYRAYAGSLVRSGFANGAGGVAERRDHVLAFRAQIDFPIKDWFYISVANLLQYNKSNCVTVGGGTAILDPCSYLRDDVWLRLGVNY